MITYNHEKYILDALNGVFSQKFNFKCELVIFDDCSTDSTVELIQKYFKENDSIFESITLNVNPINLGVSKNFFSSLSNCDGKYIAICEGDDFWIDSLKLNKQVDFLENNDDYVICYHKVKILNSFEYLDDYFNQKNISQFSDHNDLIVFGNYMQTCSLVFKNLFKLFPIEKVNFLNDYILLFWISQFGKIYRFNESMGVYRIGTGIWSTLNSKMQTIHTLNSLCEVMKIVKNDNDIIALDNRVKSLTLSLLPIELQKVNINHYDLKIFLSRNINIKILLISTFYKVLNKLLCRK